MISTTDEKEIIKINFIDLSTHAWKTSKLQEVSAKLHCI